MYLVVCLVCLIISIPGFISKSGEPWWKGIIPIVNIYYFLKGLKLSPILLMVLALGLICLPDRLLILTIMCIFFPFIVTDAYGHGKIVGLLGLIFPMLIYLWLAYISGVYTYVEKKQ